MEKNIDIAENDAKQYIVVKIGSEQYGIDISYIDNIVRMQKITRVPKIQTYFKGVINLRGEIVPVMSVRKKMNLDDDVITNASRIIILKLEEKGTIGIIAPMRLIRQAEARTEKPCLSMVLANMGTN